MITEKKDATIYWTILINLLILDLCTSCAHFEVTGFVHRLHYYWWKENMKFTKMKLGGICTLHIDHWNLGWTNVLINIDSIVNKGDFDWFRLLDLCTSCAHLGDSVKIWPPEKGGQNCKIAEKVIFLDLLPSELSKTVINSIWPKNGLVHFLLSPLQMLYILMTIWNVFNL